MTRIFKPLREIVRTAWRQPLAVRAIWAVLVFELVSALLSGHYGVALIALATLALSLVPVAVVRRFGIRLPAPFYAFIVAFIFASIFLGEAQDYYERFWWWDLLLHGSSALALGLLGFVFIFMLFEGDRYAAPPWAIGLLSFSMALSVGALWEIFEFSMDQLFRLNMQKSGLPDTMGDLIVDALGAAIGGIAGGLYLKGKDLGGTRPLIDAFIQANRRFYRRLRERLEREERL